MTNISNITDYGLGWSGNPEDASEEDCIAAKVADTAMIRFVEMETEGDVYLLPPPPNKTQGCLSSILQNDDQAQFSEESENESVEDPSASDSDTASELSLSSVDSESEAALAIQPSTQNKTEIHESFSKAKGAATVVAVALAIAAIAFAVIHYGGIPVETVAPIAALLGTAPAFLAYHVGGWRRKVIPITTVKL